MPMIFAKANVAFFVDLKYIEEMNRQQLYSMRGLTHAISLELLRQGTADWI